MGSDEELGPFGFTAEQARRKIIPRQFLCLYDKHADDRGRVRFRAFYGGRGSAKSHSIARALLTKGRAKRLRILCCRETQVSMKDSVKKLFDDLIADMRLGHFYVSTDSEIRGINGTLIIFKGMRTDPQGIKSTEGIDIAWVEEANYVSAYSLSILRPTIRKPGSEIWFTWNPRRKTDPVDHMFRGPQGAPAGSIVRQVNFLDLHPFFRSDELTMEMEDDKRRDPDKYQNVWLGGYERISAATVFRNWRPAIFDTPRDARFYFGADFGFAADPSTLVRCWIDEDKRRLYVDREAYMHRCETQDLPKLYAGVLGARPEELAVWSEKHDELWPGVPGSTKWPVVGDSSRPETISFMQQKNFRMTPSIKGPGSVEDGIGFLKGYDIWVHEEHCPHTQDEFHLYSYKTDRLTGEVIPELADDHNHCIDALRYALESVRRGHSGVLDLAVTENRERREAEALEVRSSNLPAEHLLVTLLAPPYIFEASGIRGTLYKVGQDGAARVAKDDAVILRRAGWKDPPILPPNDTEPPP